MTTVFSTPLSFTNFHPTNRPNDGITEQDKKQYEKLLKYARKKNKNWSERRTAIVPLNIPTLSDNRWTNFGRITASVKDSGIDEGIRNKPVIVAIPGELVRKAMADVPGFTEYWEISDTGFFQMSAGPGKHIQEWYLMVCDGRHRQVMRAAEINHPLFDSFKELKGTWEGEVTFWEGEDDAITAMRMAHKLYLDINKRKIRTSSGQDCLGSLVAIGDAKTLSEVSRMKEIGVWVEGGKRPFGDYPGVKTKYALFARDGLRNTELNDDLLKKAVNLIKKLDIYDPTNATVGKDIIISSTLITGLAHAYRVFPKLANGNGMQTEFEKWFLSKIDNEGTDQWVEKWKAAGGNQDNKYAESVALGMLDDFKKKLLLLKNRKGKHNSLYGELTIDDISFALFPPKPPKQDDAKQDVNDTLIETDTFQDLFSEVN